MTTDQILDDLTYASKLAREGAETPLLGGRIGLMWGVLLSAIFTVQWAILSGVLAMPASNLGYFWAAFAIIGGIGSAVMGRKIEEKDGARSTANRVEKFVWIMFSAMMGSLFVGVILNILLSGGGVGLFSLMVVFGFAGQGFAYGVVSLVSDIKWLRLVSVASFATAAVSFALYDNVLIYLVGGVASIFTIVVPSLLTMKAEPQDG